MTTNRRTKPFPRVGLRRGNELTVFVQGDFSNVKKLIVKKAEFEPNSTAGGTTTEYRIVRRSSFIGKNCDYACLTMRRIRKVSKSVGAMAGGPVSGRFTVTLDLGAPSYLESCVFEAIDYVD